MQLEDTVEMMNSEDYKERFKAEYYQLLLRLDALTGMLIKWENNMLDFEPKCSKETLENQVIFMQGYMSILRLRVEIEGIELQLYLIKITILINNLIIIRGDYLIKYIFIIGFICLVYVVIFALLKAGSDFDDEVEEFYNNFYEDDGLNEQYEIIANDRGR